MKIVKYFYSEPTYSYTSEIIVNEMGNYVDAKYVCGCGVYFDTENDLENLLEANADVLKRLKNI